MKNLRKNLSEVIENSISWVLPIGLVVATFIILFFGISEQVGNLRIAIVSLYSEVNTLANDVEKMQKNGETNTVEDKSVTVKGENTLYKELRAAEENIDLTKEIYWGYNFKTTSSIDGNPEVITVENTYVLNYRIRSDAQEESVFKLFKLNKSEKNISVDDRKFENVLVFIDGKLVFFNDFKNNDKNTLRSILETLKNAENKSENLSSGIDAELQKL